MKSLFYHEEHEDGIAGKLLLDVMIWHVDGRSMIEIATTAAQPRNDNFPNNLIASTPGALPSGEQRGDTGVRGVEFAREFSRPSCRSAMTTSGLLAFMHHDGRL